MHARYTHTHTHTHTAVLVLFLNQQLLFTEDSATAIYHAFIMLCYLLPLLGAIISDSCLGKYVYVVATCRHCIKQTSCPK